MIGVAALIGALLSTYLTGRGRRTAYLMGIIVSVLTSLVALHNQLYGTVAFYLLVTIPLYVHGFLGWGKKLKRTGEVKERRMRADRRFLVLTLCLLGSFIGGLIFGLIPGQQLSYLDVAAGLTNICGIVLMNLRYMEMWGMYLVSDFLDLMKWGLVFLLAENSEALMMFAVTIGYLLMSFYGLLRWAEGTKRWRRGVRRIR